MERHQRASGHGSNSQVRAREVALRVPVPLAVRVLRDSNAVEKIISRTELRGREALAGGRLQQCLACDCIRRDTGAPD
jgi:hypothetical protein